MKYVAVMLVVVMAGGCVCGPLQEKTQQFTRDRGPLDLFAKASQPGDGVDPETWMELRKELQEGREALNRLASQ